MSEKLVGQIYKAMSGFYYVKAENETVECRARGRFRVDKVSPVVGDYVEIQRNADGKGTVTEILPRTGSFVRPPVANVQVLIMVASAVNPITDPFLIDRVAAVSKSSGCQTVLCLNKCDLDTADSLYEIYSRVGMPVIRTSAETGQGLEDLKKTIYGKLCAFTGNSGVGKSSLLNALQPGLSLAVGEVSEKLGRGRHTTRHVELFDLDCGARIVDTPGFSSFDVEEMEPVPKEVLQGVFEEFSSFLGNCRFADCSHTKEAGCAVIDAVKTGVISPSRYESYCRLYEQAKEFKDWEKKDYVKLSNRK